MARFMRGIAMPAAQHVMAPRAVQRRGQNLLGVRAYQSVAPIQAAPSSQRAIYTNFAIYKGKGAAAFRVCCPITIFYTGSDVPSTSSSTGQYSKQAPPTHHCATSRIKHAALLLIPGAQAAVGGDA